MAVSAANRRGWDEQDQALHFLQVHQKKSTRRQGLGYASAEVRGAAATTGGRGNASSSFWRGAGDDDDVDSSNSTQPYYRRRSPPTGGGAAESRGRRDADDADVVDSSRRGRGRGEAKHSSSSCSCIPPPRGKEKEEDRKSRLETARRGGDSRSRGQGAERTWSSRRSRSREGYDDDRRRWRAGRDERDSRVRRQASWREDDAAPHRVHHANASEGRHDDAQRHHRMHQRENNNLADDGDDGGCGRRRVPECEDSTDKRRGGIAADQRGGRGWEPRRGGETARERLLDDERNGGPYHHRHHNDSNHFRGGRSDHNHRSEKEAAAVSTRGQQHRQTTCLLPSKTSASHLTLSSRPKPAQSRSPSRAGRNSERDSSCLKGLSALERLKTRVGRAAGASSSSTRSEQHSSNSMAAGSQKNPFSSHAGRVQETQRIICEEVAAQEDFFRIAAEQAQKAATEEAKILLNLPDADEFGHYLAVKRQELQERRDALRQQQNHDPPAEPRETRGEDVSSVGGGDLTSSLSAIDVEADHLAAIFGAPSGCSAAVNGPGGGTAVCQPRGVEEAGRKIELLLADDQKLRSTGKAAWRARRAGVVVAAASAKATTSPMSAPTTASAATGTSSSST